jgi:hypothetical protein
MDNAAQQHRGSAVTEQHFFSHISFKKMYPYIGPWHIRKETYFVRDGKRREMNNCILQIIFALVVWSLRMFVA